MAKIASLCCILVLAMFAGSGFAQNTTTQFGSLTYNNLASYDVTYSSDFAYNDGSYQVESQPLSKGHSVEFEIVSPDTFCVSTTFTMATPAGHYLQTVMTWCRGEGLTCMPDCYWVVEDNGFSWGNSANSSLNYMVNWGAPQP